MDLRERGDEGAFLPGETRARRRDEWSWGYELPVIHSDLAWMLRVIEFLVRGIGVVHGVSAGQGLKEVDKNRGI